MPTSVTPGSLTSDGQVQCINPDFANCKGVVIYQRTQKAEALMEVAGLPYEQKNQYKISMLPADKKVKENQGDTAGWQPSNKDLAELPMMIDMREESSCWVRTFFKACNMPHLRPMKVHLFEPNGAEQQESFMIDRPFAFGGMCCCALLGVCRPDCLLQWHLKTPDVVDANGNVTKEGQMLGMVRENLTPCMSKCIEFDCCCTAYTDIMEGTSPDNMQVVYQTRAGTCCFGGHNNFCGATCCKNDILIDVLDANGQKVSTIQKTYAAGQGPDGCCDTGFCRMCFYFSNYLVEFPENATPNQRALLIASVLHNDFLLFERDENENGGE